MKVLPYEIVEDPYIMEGKVYTSPGGTTTRQDDTTFTHSIVRPDGSRVFRAQTMKFAMLLQERLLSARLPE